MSNDNGTQDHSPETGLARAQEVITEVSKILDAAGMSFLVAISTPATIEVGGESRVVPLALGSVSSQPTQGLNLLDATWMALGQYFVTGYEGCMSSDIMAATIESAVPKVEMSSELYRRTQAAASDTLSSMLSMQMGKPEMEA
jgi:hypothetical protein